MYVDMNLLVECIYSSPQFVQAFEMRSTEDNIVGVG